ncbi:hypothetical protein [Ehrlichia muris]|uniref:Uncharacterized protein n=1 Tax=Ehrlichia muris AS145 TaxID=1423892 RepID=V9R8U1_9RICK|nr:hypothetical protein [Ehrlichia muris]AHC39718.1 hypothetical protein EMUR_02525 [Ehrlichia muris AS145]
MHLILLSSVRSELILLPAKDVHFNKMLGYCYTSNNNLNMQIAMPVMDDMFYKRIYRTKFTDYNIVSSELLNLSLVFLYGKNPVSEPAHLVFMCPSDLIPTLFQEGVLLNTSTFLTAGVNYRPDLSLKDKTKCLFDDVKNRVSIRSSVPDGRMYRFSYLDSSGNMFHQSYQSTVLELVRVDEVSNDVEFVMKMQ